MQKKFGIFYLFSFITSSLGFETDFRLVEDNVFSLANNDSYILNSFNTSNSLCETSCLINHKCAGYYINNQSNYYCNTLSSMGKLEQASINEYSYVKYINYTNTIRSDSTIKIYILSISNNLFSNNINTTVYIDENHNAINDDKYQLDFKPGIYYQKIENLTSGVYEIRQNMHTDECYQGYPGLNGSYVDLASNGYVNNVINYYHDGKSGYNHHESIGNPHGGFVNSSQLYYNGNFSFLLGDDNNTFLSFFPGDNITLHFDNDIIFDSEGVDIFFNIFNRTTTNNYAKVYGGLTQDSMTYIDILNYSHYNFDLGYYNIDLPLRYIKLEFLGDEYIHFNLKNILFNKITRHNNENSYFVKINENDYSSVFFINYCGKLECEIYCDFNLYNTQDYYSCLHGCDMFKRYHYCDCETNEFKEEIFNYYNYSYVSRYCNLGCQYSFNEYLGPNYTVIMNKRILDHSILSIDFDNRELLDLLVNECDNNDECSAISLGDETGYITDDTSNEAFENNHSFISILKNRIPTSTPTSTQTTSPTSTQTTSPTSTQTTSPTSTQTTSPTSTQTTSPTSTQSTSPTSTHATSLTSTQTTSLTSTQTTSLTTSPTTIYNNYSVTNNFEYYYIIIMAGIIAILLVLGVVYFRMIKNKKIPQISHETPSFSNPIYNTSQTDVGDDIEERNELTFYQDVYYRQAYEAEAITDNNTLDNIEDDYLDVNQNDGANSYTTSSTTDF